MHQQKVWNMPAATPRSYRPARGRTSGGEAVTWYEHAGAHAEAKWPNLAPVSRRSLAEALVAVTVALITREPSAPEPRELRQALFGWAFGPVARDQAPPGKVTAALGWAQRASLPVAALQDTATVRLALTASARNLDGKPAAGSTQRRKRSVFYNVLSSRVGEQPVQLLSRDMRPGDSHPGQGGVRVVPTASAIADCGKSQKSARKIGL